MPDSSILDSTKKVLGFDSDYTAFDPDVTMHINTAFFSLQQLGVGPADGFLIEDKTTTWDQFVPQQKMSAAVKTYVYLRVRMLFDPPATSFALDAITKQITELEWRLNVEAENMIKPNPEIVVQTQVILPAAPGGEIPAEAEVGDIILDPTTGDVWRAE
jgi:hypothetical protein